MAQQKRHHNSGNRHNNNNRNDNRNHQGNRNKGQQNQKPDSAPKKENAPKSQSKTESSNDLLIFIVFLIALATFFLARKFYFKPQQNSLYATSANLEFMKEGKLTFLDAQSDENMISIDKGVVPLLILIISLSLFKKIMSKDK